MRGERDYWGNYHRLNNPDTKLYESEAKKRQVATQNNDAGRAVTEIFPEQETGEAREQVELAGTRPNTNPDLTEIFPGGASEAREQAASGACGDQAE